MGAGLCLVPPSHPWLPVYSLFSPRSGCSFPASSCSSSSSPKTTRRKPDLICMQNQSFKNWAKSCLWQSLLSPFLLFDLGIAPLVASFHTGYLRSRIKVLGQKRGFVLILWVFLSVFTFLSFFSLLFDYGFYLLPPTFVCLLSWASSCPSGLLIFVLYYPYWLGVVYIF